MSDHESVHLPFDERLVARLASILLYFTSSLTCWLFVYTIYQDKTQEQENLNEPIYSAQLGSARLNFKIELFSLIANLSRFNEKLIEITWLVVDNVPVCHHPAERKSFFAPNICHFDWPESQWSFGFDWTFLGSFIFIFASKSLNSKLPRSRKMALPGSYLPSWNIFIQSRVNIGSRGSFSLSQCYTTTPWFVGRRFPANISWP